MYFATAAVYYTKLFIEESMVVFWKDFIICLVVWPVTFCAKMISCQFRGSWLVNFYVYTNCDVRSSLVLMRHYVIADMGEQR